MKELERTLLDGAFAPHCNEYTEAGLDGFDAAPLLLVGPEKDEELAQRQNKLVHFFTGMAYAEVLRHAKPDVALFAARSIYSRMQQRQGSNAISYVLRKHRLPRLSIAPDTPEENVLEACERAKRGGATPLQNNLARQAFGMASVELANLTTFGERRAELRDPMWQAVGELITDSGIALHENHPYRISALGFDRNPSCSQHIGAMRISAKTKLGELSDGATVKLRTTAIINTRPNSDFDQTLVKTITAMAREHNEERFMREVAAFDRFQTAVQTILRENPDLILARNDTFYAASPEE